MRDVLRLTFFQALRLPPRLVAGFTGATGFGSTGRLLRGVLICCTCVKVLEGHFLVSVKELWHPLIHLLLGLFAKDDVHLIPLLEHPAADLLVLIY